MLSESNDALPIETLKNRLKLANFAICILWIAAVFTLIAIWYKYSNEGVFEKTTFIIVIVALLLSIPVVINRGRIKKIIHRRAENNNG